MLVRWLLARLAPFIALVGCATAPVAPDRFGVVALTTKEHLPCTTFSTDAIPGERVEIVLLPSQQVIGATLGSPVPACGFGQEPGHAYRLALDHAADQIGGSVAVRAKVPPSISFRQCAGSEALHLTAWVNDRRIWHGFYYLGYDVEPDCKPGELD
jgi:hypothetical protein